ncbi:MAG: ABC transporter ATP-binding protein [Alphaproteobacteria bacterium]|nr:ABC transporter ATP-binding protein [Alphaproteobacteria bacterium]
MNSLVAQGLLLTLSGRPVLSGLDFTLAAGEFVVLAGPNGAGKSTLLRALARLRSPAAGRLLLDGDDLGRMSRETHARRVAYLPQAATVRWPLRLDHLVALGRLPHRTAKGWDAAADAQAIARALADMALAGLAERRVDTLSGGEVARALLARALAVEGEVSLLDEPVAALDPLHQLATMQRLRARACAGRMVLAVLHDLTLASRFADRVLLLAGGRLLADGPPAVALSDANLASAFGIVAERGARGGSAYLLPWEAAPMHGPPPCR